METKEKKNGGINLAEILSGHEGETFWNPLLGDIQYRQYDSQHLYFVKVGKETATGEVPMLLISTNLDGTDTLGNPAVFPNRNQLDWMRFDMECNTKRWRAKKDYGYYYIDRRLFVKHAYEQGSDFDNNNYINGNCFKSEADAKEMCSTFKKLLYQYHKDHPVTD